MENLIVLLFGFILIAILIAGFIFCMRSVLVFMRSVFGKATVDAAVGQIKVKLLTHGIKTIFLLPSKIIKQVFKLW